ncbi:MAG: hypothetical protein OXR62_00755 [Ahrensia sp.]|nr:hypothetical protein [Ahrensia sp.]
MSQDARKGPKIGVLVPFTNTNLEPDMLAMCPTGCTMHFQRLGGYDVEEIPDAEQMAGLGASDIDHDLRMIAGVRPKAVIYGCTSATLTHGPRFDRDLAAKINARTGAFSITAAGSLITALQALKATQVGFASPYVGDINDQAIAFLEQHSVETVQRADIGRALDNYGQGELSPNEVFELALKADTPRAQAIVLSCTDMRSVETIQHIEEEVGKPVVASNQAMIFSLCRLLGLTRNPGMPGMLFDRL